MTSQISIASAKVDGLLFTRMRVNERLGELFTYEVEFESQNLAIDLNSLLKSPMAIKLETQDGYTRYFHGMVCEAEQTSVEQVQSLVYAKYRARLVPRPWLLRRMVDCRIFKNQSTTDIAKTLMSEAGYTDVKLDLSGTYPQREYCVQYREDGLNFINRLLQQEGIYYYFTHSANKHEMVLADGVGSHAVATDFDNVPFQPARPSVLRAQSTISEWTSLRGVDGTTCQLTDYNPLKPKASLMVSGDAEGHGVTGVEVFDYPGRHQEADRGKHFAQVRAEAASAERSRYLGVTDACSIHMGGLFTLKDYPRKELNCEYLITAAVMELEGPGYASGSDASSPAFHCRFEALESSKPWRSPQTARWPAITGLQTAVVTGSKTNEDIVVDKYGRVQVNFQWDMPGRKNADCSCPVRVATPWAGKGWGAVSLPRVGQEVVVSFIEGDPDRPLIVGSVYNAVNTPPYSLPTNKTQSGILTRSLLGETADFNELRFEDKKGEEDVLIHAQKDMHKEVENDYTVTIDHDEVFTIKNDQTGTINNDRKHTVKNDDTLDVTNNGTTTIGKVFKLDAGQTIKLVCGQASITMASSGEIDIVGTTVKINGKQTVNAEAGMTLALKSGTKATLSATMIDITADAKAGLKGSMTSVGGSGITQVSGSILKLG